MQHGRRLLRGCRTGEKARRGGPGSHSPAPPREALAPLRPGHGDSAPSHPSRIGGSGARPLSDAQIDGDWKRRGDANRGCRRKGKEGGVTGLDRKIKDERKRGVRAGDQTKCRSIDTQI